MTEERQIVVMVGFALTVVASLGLLIMLVIALSSSRR